MRLSEQLVKSTNDSIDEMDPAHIALLQGLTVRLHGMVGQGNHSTFIGTGFILRADATDVYVITAKHNLHVAATGMGKSGNGLRDYFKQKVKVEFIRINGQVVKGDIDDIVFPDGTTNDERYDVAILKIHHINFAKHVGAFLAPSRSIMYMFASLAWQKKTSNLIVEVFSTGDAKEVLANGVSHWHLKNVEYLDARKNYSLLQFGWGLDNSVQHTFGRRVLSIADLENRTYIPETHEGYLDVSTFDCNNNNTSQPGDSGGPIFALDESGTHSWLIGVALGANYYSDKTDDSNNISNNAFSVISTNRISESL